MQGVDFVGTQVQGLGVLKALAELRLGFGVPTTDGVCPAEELEDVGDDAGVTGGAGKLKAGVQVATRRFVLGLQSL